MHASARTAAAGLALLAGRALAIDIDTSSSQSLSDAAGTIAASVMSRYSGDSGNGSIPGLFPSPYYFWESGLAWDSLLYYTALTGDEQYNDAISQGLLWQVGPNHNYLPPNQTKSLGNDDQSFWAMAAMTAEESGFAPPESENVTSWRQLAQNVFDSQVVRWDTETCDGGLRWQIFAFNNGYDYKNSMTNGNFMQLAARLYASTRNETYAEWFNTAGSWMAEVGLYDNETGAVFDGTSTVTQCRDLNHIQWSANTGILLSAYAYMLSTDASSVTDPSPIAKLLNTTQDIFVRDSVLTEPACLPNENCNVDQLAFRGILARALAAVGTLVPSQTNGTLGEILAASAQAAGSQCSGGASGSACGADWTKSQFDGSTGLSQDLSALNAVLAAMSQGAVLGEQAGGGNGSATSSGGPSGSSGGASPSASASAPVQQDENRGEQRAASMFGLLGAMGFAVAFFL